MSDAGIVLIVGFITMRLLRSKPRRKNARKTYQMYQEQSPKVEKGCRPQNVSQQNLARENTLGTD
jgi:hypothetical protein